MRPVGIGADGEQVDEDRRIRCRSEGPACINGVVDSSAHTPALVARPPVDLDGWRRRASRAPWRRGAWSPEEVAGALGARRRELRRQLDWRRDARGVPAGVRDEVLDDAIALVVMSREPIRHEQHLLGAFWRSVWFLLAEHRAGRHALRVGHRQRVEFDDVVLRLSDGSDPFALVALSERVAQAADWMAQLDPFERRVVAVMATRGFGVKLAARALGEPVKTVLGAARSADRKLEQVAKIAAAGRMCEYRQPAIAAHARGTARAEQQRVAEAHLDACLSCRRLYARELAGMRGRDFRRAASAAFLPAPVAGAMGHAWLERLAGLLPTGRVPSGTGVAERTAGLLGGGGIVKAAAASTVLVVASAGVGERVISSLSNQPHHLARQARTAQRAEPHPTRRPAVPPVAVRVESHPTALRVQRRVSHKSRALPPSRKLGYLALGSSAGPGRSSQITANAASNTSSSGGEGAPPPSTTGGGTSLSYLGR